MLKTKKADINTNGMSKKCSISVTIFLSMTKNACFGLDLVPIIRTNGARFGVSSTTRLILVQSTN